MEYSFDEKISTPLCEIMGRNRSDKGNINIIHSWHNYTTFYHHLFNYRRSLPLKIFELGLGTNNLSFPSNMGENGRPGASLYGWSDFFYNSVIFGADIDKDILFQTDRIKTFFCDQTNSNIIKNMWEEPLLTGNFDIIIDDGLHSFDANVCFFENSIHKLNKNGYYIIEDILNVEKHLFENKIKEWEEKYPNMIFKLVCISSHINYHDNNLLVVFKFTH
jgi:hypothetical protein